MHDLFNINDIAYNSQFDLSQSISVRNKVNTSFCLVEENIDGPMWFKSSVLRANQYGCTICVLSFSNGREYIVT